MNVQLYKLKFPIGEFEAPEIFFLVPNGAVSNSFMGGVVYKIF